MSPRQQRADIFEQNPLSQVSHQLDSAALALMEDSERVREAVRAVVERGGDLRQAARDWKVAPSSVAEWRERYYELLQQDSIATTGVALFEPDIRRDDMDLVRIPETARVRFLDNWERLVQETVSSPAAFIQSPRQVFLENSWLTCWLYEDGELDKGILAGVISGAVAVVITLSFLVARQASPVVVYTPSPPSAEAAATDGTLADQAVLAAQTFFQASNWRERLTLVRHPETVRAGMERYYSTHSDGPITDAKMVMGLNSKNVTSLNFEIPSQNRSHFLNIAYENGIYLVDWESSSLFQEENLSILRERKSTEPTRIAVTVSKNDSYYNYAFSDSSKWTGFELAYPGLPMTLYGYTLRDSQLTIDLEAMLGILKKQSVILEVRYPENAKSDNQVEILRILGEEWIPGI
ncbi:MAG: hypothetical protein EOP86_13690 [Verrucomicrobiaceae bacterium]|nr:MAG: hypothetical protein EOP86_13690 [Verrucomicrobiaceae bacterium]